jgi:hypothetical protein
MEFPQNYQDISSIQRASYQLFALIIQSHWHSFKSQQECAW